MSNKKSPTGPQREILKGIARGLQLRDNGPRFAPWWLGSMKAAPKQSVVSCVKAGWIVLDGKQLTKENPHWYYVLTDAGKTILEEGQATEA